jgi:hypothetical protein
VLRFVDQASRAGQFELRHAFLDRASCYAEEVFVIRFGESSVAFGDIRGDRQCGSVELVDKESIPKLKLFCRLADVVSEVD